MSRTFARDDFLRGQEAWAEYPDWEPLRIMSREWTCFPPSGSKWDQWDSEDPTQSALVARAWSDNRPELLRIVGRSHSWSQVIRGIIQLERRLSEEADQRERDYARDKADHPTHVGAAMSIKAILNRMADS